MKNKCFLLLLIIGLVACDKKKEDAVLNEKYEFVYSRGDVGAGAEFSLKFSNGDTLFFQKCKYNPERIVAYSLIQEDDKQLFLNILHEIKWADFDSTYIQQHLEDGSGYKFCIKTDKVRKWVYIYGKEGPVKLYALASWVEKLKARKFHDFQPINKNVDFGDLSYIIGPEPARHNSR